MKIGFNRMKILPDRQQPKQPTAISMNIGGSINSVAEDEFLKPPP